MVLGVAAALASAAATGAELPSLEPCVERVADAASAPPPPPRLAQLRYRCLALRNGQRVLVGEAGKLNPRTVLLVHGLGNNAHRDWAGVIPALAAKFHVVALVLPGFGASPGSAQAD